MQSSRKYFVGGVFFLVVAAALTGVLSSGQGIAAAAGRHDGGRYIVQGHDVKALAGAVREVGGEVTHELGIIHAVGARLTAGERAALEARGEVRRIYADREVRASKAHDDDSDSDSDSGPYRDSHFPTQIKADLLHQDGITGHGVTVAAVDSGLWKQLTGLRKNAHGTDRILVHYDAIKDKVAGTNADDGNGHGSHVWSVLASSLRSASSGGKFNGVAPNADIVSVQAFDKDGEGTYADVIRGIDFVVTHKDAYGIRVLNLSMSAPPRSFYWDDPLNQAVMAAWRAGIVVVTSAGNTGPSAMSIGVPGNVPYVITVGSMTDHFTPDDPSDDMLSSYSAAGPTVEAFVKPDLIAPGGHMLGLMKKGDRLLKDHPEFNAGYDFFMMSGTSQAAAVVSGVVALMLEADPGLAPDDVKCRLMASARPAVDQDGDLIYGPMQQGSGLIDAHAAVASTLTGCANPGLDVDVDLSGEHFVGPVRFAGGHFVIGDGGYPWDTMSFSSDCSFLMMCPK